MASVITIAGEKLFAAKAQANEQLDIDTFIFANVPDQDATAPINREEGLPIDHVVHQQIVQQVGRINDNVVVYSTVLDSITGPFEFNWVGLYSSINNTLVAINHIPTTPKTKTEAGVAGNTLNRNFGIEYSGIADLTGIDVAPETWQLDFTARLQGMDKLTQQLAKDLNGKDSFIDDGFKVVPRETLNTFAISPGVGYVGGLRIEFKHEHIIAIEDYEKAIFVDVWFDGDASSKWSPSFTFHIRDDELEDYVDGAGKSHFVTKLALIKSNDDVEDFRVSFTEKFDKSTINYKNVEEYKNSDEIFKEGKRIFIEDRAAHFIVKNGIGENDGFHIIGSEVFEQYIELEFNGNSVTAKSFGAVNMAECTEAIQAWVNYAKQYNVDAYNSLELHFTSLTIPNEVNFSGAGLLKGSVSGEKPNAADLTNTNSLGRLSLLKEYYQSEINIEDQATISGSLKIVDALTLSGSNTKVLGVLEMENCAAYGAGFSTSLGGTISAPNLIVCDSKGTGAHTINGGLIEIPDSIIIGSASRGLFTQNGGTITAPNSFIVDGADEGVFTLYGGVINIPNSMISRNERNGLLVNYGGNINAFKSVVSANGRSGATCESNGAIYLKEGTIENNGTQGVQTVFGGFIQALDSKILNNGTFGVQGNDSGLIQISGALIDDSNNSGKTVIRANGIAGILDDEGPGGIGKESLTNEHYSPGYNRTGNGNAYIGSGSQDNAQVGTPVHILSNPNTLTIKDGSVQANRSLHYIDTEGNNATDDLVEIRGGVIGKRLILMAEHSARTIVLKDGVNNLALSNGDFMLEHENDAIELIYNRLGMWAELSRTNNNQPNEVS
ncbi:phage tail-collar fiber domain-containing protein [Pseudoalteromonas sp. C12FD-1]|uniref:phage tail-collar fiber domain-containing protein n=1 Tax=Pseudoalteromonas sp. C12FD-1 TaxID=3131979 RepID=UPI00307DD926